MSVLARVLLRTPQPRSVAWRRAAVACVSTSPPKRGLDVVANEVSDQSPFKYVPFATEPVVDELKQPEIKDEKKGGEWEDFSVEQWRDTIYTSKSYFQQLLLDTTDFVGEFCDELGGSSEDGPLLIEVGCGTGEALQPLFSRARYTCGMDFNPHFINYCKSEVPQQHRGSVRHFQGDAQELDCLLKSELPAEWNVEGRKKIAICVGNTIGIMPPAVRQNVYRKMKEIVGKDGYFVIVYWNGNTFGDAVQNFYHKNPQLCGKFTGDCIDLDTCTLTTPGGYCTHWTKPEEARAIFEEEIGAEIVQIVEKGNGVLVAGRMRA